MHYANGSTPLENVIISPGDSVREAMARLDEAGTGGLALCSGSGKLVGVLTDGDIRRATLRSLTMESPCGSICSLEPVVARRPVTAAAALQLMNEHDIHHLPVVDGEGVLCDFILRRDVAIGWEAQVQAPQRLDRVAIPPSTSIEEAISRLDQAGTGALILCGANFSLCGLLTDGDIRRAILQGKPMDAPCSTIASQHPICGSAPITAHEALQLMNRHDIHHLPVIDSGRHVIEFLLRKDLAVTGRSELSAVVMAGGFGKRLLPLTERVPKPMLPVGDRPLLELTLQQLRRCGIRNVSLTTHYLPESIVSHFGNGESFGVRLNYLKEDRPMGTAGGLKLMQRPEGPFLVINGDVLTGAPFQEMLAYHRQHGAALTVGVRKYDVQVPFGVVECADVQITRLREKPSLGFFINAGIYLLEPAAYDCIPEDRPFDMTDLIQALLDADKPVVSFPIREYWLDVGRREDYQQAQDDVLQGRI